VIAFTAQREDTTITTYQQPPDNQHFLQRLKKRTFLHKNKARWQKSQNTKTTRNHYDRKITYFMTKWQIYIQLQKRIYNTNITH